MSAVRRLLPFLLGAAVLVMPAFAATKPVAIRNFAYDPPTITIAPGDTVTWTNHDASTHTVTGDNDLTLRSNSMAQGGRYEHTFPVAGSFPYHCDFHQNMRGTVTVQPGGGGGTTTTTAAASTTTRPSTTTTTTRRTTTTLDAKESSVTARRDTTTTSSTVAGETTTTTTLVGDTTSTSSDDLAAPDDTTGNGDDDDPSHAGPAAVAALLLAAVSGGAALAVRRGL